MNKTPSWPSWRRIVALSSTILAVEFAYSVEAGYGTPTLLKTGLEERYASLMWSTGPVLGIVFQSYLGSASDKCACSWGKRRPFIALIGAIILVALAMFPYGSSLARWCGLSSIKTFLIVYTSLWFVCMDFSLDAIQSPSRSFLLDSLSEEQTRRGNLIYSAMMGVGATLGSIVSAIPWKKLGGELGNNFDTQIKVVFGFTVGLFFVCLLTSLASVDESLTRYLRLRHSPKKANASSEANACTCSSFTDIARDFCTSIQGTFSFASNMSASFLSLWILVFLSYFSLNSYYLFFTEYVGSVIYGGAANSDEKLLRDLYDDGVLAGCACLVLCNSMLFLASILLDPLLVYSGVALKQLALFVCLVHMMAIAAAMLIPCLVTAVVMSLMDGLFFAVMASLPFTLLSQYERDGILLRSSKDGPESSIGKAVSFLFIAIFAAQFILGLTMGNLIQVFRTSHVIVVTTFVAQVLATGFLICTFDKSLKFPK